MHRTAANVKSRAKPDTTSQDPRRLKRRRTMSGLSLTDVAHRAGISKGHLSDLENGYVGASAPMLGKLAGVLECEITDLMPPDPDENGAAA